MWCRLVAAAPIRLLAWVLPYAAGVVLNRKKKNSRTRYNLEVSSPCWFHKYLLTRVYELFGALKFHTCTLGTSRISVHRGDGRTKFALNQWSASEVEFAPRGSWQYLEIFLVVTLPQMVDVCVPLAAGRERPEMLPNILQCTAWSPTTETYPAPGMLRSGGWIYPRILTLLPFA